MAKKDFNSINTGSRVSSTLEKATSNKGRQSTATKDEQEERAAQGRTQGRKGCRVGRYNIGFTTDNRDYIAIMSRLRGETMTDFINYVIAEHRNEHGDTYEQAKKLIKGM